MYNKYSRLTEIHRQHPYKGDFEGGGVEVACPAAARGLSRGCRQREAVRGTAAGVATSILTCSNSVGDVVTVPGVMLQWWGWPHRDDSDGEDRSRWPDVTV
jgi:hypothetical protein